MGLELRRKAGQEITIQNDKIKPIKIKVLSVIDGEAILSFEAANDVIINRSEFTQKKETRNCVTALEARFKISYGRNLCDVLEERAQKGDTISGVARSLELAPATVKNFSKKYGIKFKKYPHKELVKNNQYVWR